MNASAQQNGSIIADEAAHFGKLAADWWDPNGSSAMLHKLNPPRLRHLRATIDAHWGCDPQALRPLTGRHAADVGCGAGLLTEPLARLGARVTGVDAAPENIAAARLHAEKQGLAIDYRQGGIETLAGERFDLVTSMEVIEHVADPAAYLAACHALTRPGGLMVCSTLNRNAKSYLMAIIGAEHVMRWLPKGTHEWSKFITPDELYALLRGAGFEPVDRKGMVFNPLGWSWHLSARDLSVNYVTASLRR